VNNYMAPLSKIEFEIIEGVFHDGLGTFAELALAIKLIELAGLDRKQLALSDIEGKIRDAEAKMQKAISSLPNGDKRRAVFEREIANVSNAAERGARELLDRVKPATLIGVRHVAREFAGAMVLTT
jgi:hypothetical protein